MAESLEMFFRCKSTILIICVMCASKQRVESKLKCFTTAAEVVMKTGMYRFYWDILGRVTVEAMGNASVLFLLILTFS